MFREINHPTWRKMAQTGPLKEVSTFERMNDPPQLFFSNKVTLLYRMDDSKRSFEKNILPLQKKLMLQIDPLNSSCS